jgi:glucose-1-phosphate thymidylyltransferase|tara:strand:+ start:3645 stop:4514 length:870 start_codon:yes stop_codon:yes gene_type:complete
MNRKGIILAGGNGTRLYPATIGVSKQLMPIYDKPMIYYPLSVLMLAGIREIALIIKQADLHNFQQFLGDGSQWGLSIQYIIQPSPDGLAQAYLLAKNFLNGAPSAMVLGDNIFYGAGFSEILLAANNESISSVFGYEVINPSDYGVVEFDDSNVPMAIHEKPIHSPSNVAITGLYFLDNSASEKALTIQASARGELEITSLLNLYIQDKNLKIVNLGRGFSWLDTGSHNTLLEAGNFIKAQQSRQISFIGCIEEIAFTNGWISSKELEFIADSFPSNAYGLYLKSLLHN